MDKYDGMTVKDLRAEATRLEIPGRSKLTKKVDLLREVKKYAQKEDTGGPSKKGKSPKKTTSKKGKSPVRRSPSPKKISKEVERKIVYDYLKKEYQESLSKGKFNVNILSKAKVPDKNTPLNIYVLEDQNVYYIASLAKIDNEKVFSDTFGLRDWIITDLRSYNDKNGTYRKPKYVKNRGWMYFKNERNARTLTALQDAINNTNKRYRGYTVVQDTAPTKMETKYGIIGWDIPFDEPQWLIDITGNNWDRQYNPRLESNGTITFNKCAISTKAAEKSIKFLRSKKNKDGEQAWKSLYPVAVHVSPRSLGYRQQLEQFLNSDSYNAIAIGWGNHARFGYKDIDKKMFYLFDPWKKSASGKDFNTILEIARQEGYTAKFVRRDKADQSFEGSCTNVALMRAIMVAEFGMGGAFMEIPFEYPILAQRLISMKR